MTCQKCGGLSVYQEIMAVNEGLVSEQYTCLNCGYPVYLGKPRSRVPVTIRPVEKLERWVHQR